MRSPITGMNNHAHLILAIDDDVDDLSLLLDALTAVDSTCTVMTAHNGAQALAKLEQMKGEGRLPCLIVLDVNMPVMDGRQTLYAIKKDEGLKHIPLIVFSTSTSPLDVVFFEGAGALYQSKPLQFGELLGVAQRFLDYCKG